MTCRRRVASVKNVQSLNTRSTVALIVNQKKDAVKTRMLMLTEHKTRIEKAFKKEMTYKTPIVKLTFNANKFLCDSVS